MKITKRLAALALIFALLLGVTACGGQQPTPDGGAQQPVTNSNGEGAAAPQEGGQSATVIKVIATTDWEKVQMPLIEKALQQGFYTENPDIALEYEFVPFAELDKKIITSHVGGVYYDLLLTNHPSVGVFAETEIIEPLTQYVEKSQIDFSQYNESFLKSAYVGDTQYAMPYETDCRVLAINEDLLKAEGLELPKTKEDMIEIAKKVTKDLDGDGKVDQFGLIYHFTNMWFPTYDLGQWILGNGVSLFAQQGDGYVATIDTPEMLDFMDWAAQMIPYQPTDFVSYDGTQLTSLMADGKIAMFITGPWTFNDPIFLEKGGFTYTTILNPAGTVKSGSSMGGWHLGMGSMSQCKDQVWKVMEYLARPEISAITASSLPPRFDAYDHSPFNDEKYTIFKKQLETASLPAPPIPELTEIAELWNKQFQAAMLGEKTNQEALQTAQAEVQAVLDKR